MIPVLAVYQAMALGILAMVEFTAGTLGKVIPLKAPYTPGPNLLIGGVTPANFTGATAKVQGAAPDVFSDPGTGDILVVTHEPAGGWQWSPSDATALPQTIYGFGLTNAGGTGLVAVSEPLTDPVTLTAAGQVVDAGDLEFRIPLGSVV